MSISLRKWNSNDLENLVKYANNPNIANNLTNQFPHPYTLQLGKGFIVRSKSLFVYAIDLNE